MDRNRLRLRPRPSPERVAAIEHLAPEERGQLVLVGLATSLVVLPYYVVVAGLSGRAIFLAWRNRDRRVLVVLRDATSVRALLVLLGVGQAVWWAFEPLRDEAQRVMDEGHRRLVES